MASAAPRPPLPDGSDRVGAWARARRFVHEPYPDERWFRAWEPYDTMVSAGVYYNAVSWSIPPGAATITEPWYAASDSEPLDRTALLFIQHPGLMRRAAARGGEHFNTRVAYLENPPMPTVQVGDPRWDEHMVTFAASASEAVH